MPIFPYIGRRSGNECVPTARWIVPGRSRKRRLLGPVECCFPFELYCFPQVFCEVVMGLLLWIVFGTVAGALAKLVMPGPDRLGMAGTILVGVAGAVVG